MATQIAQPRKVPDLTYIEYFILLKILNKALAGIGIFEELVRETNGQLVLSPGTLYAALKRMLTQNLIEMVEVDPLEVQEGDSRRKFYQATPLGREKIIEMKAWLQQELSVVTEALEQTKLPPPKPQGTPPSSSTTKRPEQESIQVNVHESIKLIAA